MLVAIAGGINNICNGQIFIIVDKFFAVGMGKNRPAMVGAMFFSSCWLGDISLGKAQSIGGNNSSSGTFLQAVAQLPITVY